MRKKSTFRARGISCREDLDFGPANACIDQLAQCKERGMLLTDLNKLQAKGSVNSYVSRLALLGVIAKQRVETKSKLHTLNLHLRKFSRNYDPGVLGLIYEMSEEMKEFVTASVADLIKSLDVRILQLPEISKRLGISRKGG
jgi:hypothetical protein